ncbi:PREDICTED: RINT1-like protein MAG2L isoform X2 [Nelumbo nucifera]|nr:PREDICTED: RINT1-like protein MAG2L isoform X2 [Nelumbo nucifera]
MSRNKDLFSVNLSNGRHRTDFGQKQDDLLLSVKAMNDIEDILIDVAKCRPQWIHLPKAVDARVDKTLAVIRLQALADHRILLSSLGWPPPLLASELESDKSLGLPNPLVLMKEDKKDKYCKSFLSLCSLQHLQTRREKRQLGFGHEKDHSPSLWTIDELISPISSRIMHHFSEWSEQPKFIFALVYKITRDFVGGVDDVLQPLIDKARLVGYSAREAWVSAMVKMLSGYLSKRIFTVLANKYKDRNMKSEVVSSWLHLVDLIIAFDKRMQALTNLGTSYLVGDSAGLPDRGVSMLSIFCDQPDWLKIWARMEFKDARKKLKAEMENERAWVIDSKKESELNTEQEVEPFHLSTREDYRAPFVAEAVVKLTWAVIERCQTLPSINLKAKFIRSSACRILWYFIDMLCQHCKEAEVISCGAENDALMRVCGSINAARYCESVLQEWNDDVNFLEMRIAEDDSENGVRNIPDDRICFFGEQIECLIDLGTDWLMDLITDLLNHFNTLSLEYVQNKEQWSLELEEFGQNRVLGTGDLTISTNFAEALDALRNKFRVLKVGLNTKDFLDLWRSVAGGLDHFIFYGILMNDARFSKRGADQFEADMRGLFLVFKLLCLRPEAFFPRIQDSLKLLEMDEHDMKHFHTILLKEKKSECMRLNGIVHISLGEAEKILRNRKF